MPYDFPYVDPNLETLGPHVEVRVHMSRRLEKKFVAARRKVPPPVIVTAIIDTGATFSCFKPEVFARLGIEPFDVSAITTASVAREERNTYWVDISFGQHRLCDLSAIEANLIGCSAQGLIGRNVLKYARLTYDGPRSSFLLQFDV